MKKQTWMLAAAGLLAALALAGCESKEQALAKALTAEDPGAFTAAMEKISPENREAALRGLPVALLVKAVQSGIDYGDYGEALNAAFTAALQTADPEVLKNIVSPGGDFSFELNKEEDGIIITGYSGGGGGVIIPPVIEGIPVVEIRASAFLGKTNKGYALPGYEITTVVIPSTVTSIGSSAFAACEKLTGAVLPSGLEELGPYAFSGCKELYNLVIPPELETITFRSYYGDLYQFNNCKKLPLATRQRLKDLGYKGSI
jgi:hypothetical protein